MTIDATLNAVWAALALAGVAGAAFSRASTARSRLRRAAVALLAAVALFPCISTSDDLFLFQPSSQDPHRAVANLLDSLQNYQVVGIYLLLVTFGCFTLIRGDFQRLPEFALPVSAGRSPPGTAEFHSI